MIEYLGTISVDTAPLGTRSSDSANPAAKRPRTNTDPPPPAPNFPDQLEQPNQDGLIRMMDKIRHRLVQVKDMKPEKPHAKHKMAFAKWAFRFPLLKIQLH